MKKLTKVLTLCLALALVLCLAPAAFAADEPDGSAANPYVIDAGWWDFSIGEVTKAGEATFFKMVVGSDGYLSFNLQGVEDPVEYGALLEAAISVKVDIYTGDPTSSTPAESIILDALAWPPVPVISSNTYAIDDVIYMGISVLDESGAIISGYPMIEGAFGGTAMDPFGTDVFDRRSQSSSFEIPAGVELHYSNNAWRDFSGAVISASVPAAIASTTVYMNGTPYTDEDEDGVIEIPLQIADMRVVIGLKNGTASSVTYTISLKATAQIECKHSTKIDVDAQAPGCHTDGYVAHKKCDTCGTLFTTENVETTLDALIDGAENQLYYVDNTNTCTEDGEIEHWHCDGCGKNYEHDADNLTYTDVELVGQDALHADAAGHSMDHVPASGEAPTDTCCDAAVLEHWYCSNCDTYFKDEDGNDAYASYLDTFAFGPHDWVLAETVNYEPVPDNVPKAHVKTNLIYKCSCMSCYYIQWKDITKTVETAPTCGELTHHEEEPADCKNPGTKEYWSCANCEKLFSDANGEHEVLAADLVIDPDPKAHGDLDHIDAKAPCHADGWAEHWYCSVCDCYFTDDKGTANIAYLRLISEGSGELTHVAEVPASALDGVKEHWYCEGCDVYFADADGKTPVAYLTLIIPGTGGVVNTTDETDNALGADLDVPADKLADTVLSDEDKALIENGAGIRVYLEVVDISDKVSPAELELINASLDGNTAGIILDINLMKKIGSNDPVAIKKTNSPVVISLIVPESYRNTDPEMVRIYKILRIHDGKATLLDAAYDAETHELVFETDCFSTYTLVYSDEKNDSTGDPIAIVMALAMVSGGAVLVLGKKKF